MTLSAMTGRRNAQSCSCSGSAQLGLDRQLHVVLEGLRDRAVVLRRLRGLLERGGLPACARPCESAIAKQLACAAASSSSGVVFPPAASVRDFQDSPASRSTPLVRELTLPLPDIRSPSQTACARLCMARLLSRRDRAALSFGER